MRLIRDNQREDLGLAARHCDFSMWLMRDNQRDHLGALHCDFVETEEFVLSHNVKGKHVNHMIITTKELPGERRSCQESAGAARSCWLSGKPKSGKVGFC